MRNYFENAYFNGVYLENYCTDLVKLSLPHYLEDILSMKIRINSIRCLISEYVEP